MRHARLGPTGPATSRLGLGTLPVTGDYGPCDPRSAASLIGHALDSGVTLLDVADFSRGGHGLSAVRTAIADRRDDVVLAAHARRSGERGDGREGRDEEIRACEALLRRLDTDHLDLYYVHPSPSGPPIEDRVGTLAKLVAAGKVRHLGVYDVAPEDIARAHAAHPLTAVAVEYSLAARGAEQDLLPAARRLGLAVVACRPLAGGLLTGLPANPRSAGERRLLDGLRRIAAAMDLGVSRLALAWLLSRGEDVFPVPGTRDCVHLEMNLLSLDVDLPADIAAELTQLSDS